MFQDYLIPKRPPGMYNPLEYWIALGCPQLGSLVRDPLIEVLAARVRLLSTFPQYRCTHGQANTSM